MEVTSLHLLDQNKIFYVTESILEVIENLRPLQYYKTGLNPYKHFHSEYHCHDHSILYQLLS